jgi:hypothetical protein
MDRRRFLGTSLAGAFAASLAAEAQQTRRVFRSGIRTRSLFTGVLGRGIPLDWRSVLAENPVTRWLSAL